MIQKVKLQVFFFLKVLSYNNENEFSSVERNLRTKAKINCHSKD